MRGEPAAVADDDRRRQRGQEVDEREVQAVEDDGLLVRLAVVRVHLFEVLLVSRLATEGLDDADTADVLGQRRGDQAELAHGAVGP